MNELGSLYLRRIEKTMEPDFGTYHHSTSVASKKVRTVVKAMFTNAFASLPFGRHDKLRILDVGCGLGFLSCVSAEFYKNARITASCQPQKVKPRGNERERDEDRIDFKNDVFRFTPAEKFYIIVSNLVFHNFGKIRFKAYSLLSSWTQAGPFIIMGDLFFSPKTDIAHLKKAFIFLKQIKPKNGFRDYALLVMSRDSHGLS